MSCLKPDHFGQNSVGDTVSLTLEDFGPAVVTNKSAEQIVLASYQSKITKLLDRCSIPQVV